MENNQGLNGFWGWLKRHVHTIAGICTVIGLPEVGIALEALVKFDDTVSDNSTTNTGSIDKMSSKIGDYEPTVYEASILDPWVTNKLTPFYQNLLLQIKSAFNSADSNFQLQQINDVLMKICVVKSYYLNHETNGLSLPAVNLRNELLDNIFLPIEDLITNSIINESNLQLENYTVTINNPGMFLPLNVLATTVNCDKYVDYNGVLQNSPTQSLLTSTPVVVNPVTNQVISNPSTSTKKSNIGFVILSILGLAILFYPEEKKEKK